MSVNKVILVGNVGRDVEFRSTTTGTHIAKFTLATNEPRFKDADGKPHTEWHNIVVWGRLAEVCNQVVTKGRMLWVEGTFAAASTSATARRCTSPRSTPTTSSCSGREEPRRPPRSPTASTRRTPARRPSFRLTATGKSRSDHTRKREAHPPGVGLPSENNGQLAKGETVDDPQGSAAGAGRRRRRRRRLLHRPRRRFPGRPSAAPASLPGPEAVGTSFLAILAISVSALIATIDSPTWTSGPGSCSAAAGSSERRSAPLARECLDRQLQEDLRVVLAALSVYIFFKR